MIVDPLQSRPFSASGEVLNWCFSTLGCADLRLCEQTAIADKWGISRIEARGVQGVMDMPLYGSTRRWVKPSDSDCLGLARASVWAQGSSLRFSDSCETLLEGLRAYAPWMDFFGSAYLRIFDGDLPEGKRGVEAAWRRFDKWEQWRQLYGWDFAVMVETHSRFFEADEIAALFSQGHPNLFLLWDSHHTWRRTGVSALQTWQVVKPWTVHIHIKDSVTISSGGLPYCYVVPSYGEFPLRELVGVLRAQRFGGSVSLEWERHWHPQLPDIEVALQGLARVL